MTQRFPFASLSLVLAATLPGLAGCSDSNATASPLAPGGGFEHPEVALLDVAGKPLEAGATRPYSPRQTCGACHDVDRIANGYHFQQGRTDSSGRIVVRNDYFGDGRRFILSPGMYGKW